MVHFGLLFAEFSNLQFLVFLARGNIFTITESSRNSELVELSTSHSNEDKVDRPLVYSARFPPAHSGYATFLLLWHSFCASTGLSKLPRGVFIYVETV
jgi:hypothetical protein